jgi:hypothetical protein
MSMSDSKEAPMNVLRVHTTVQAGRELHLRDLPCRLGGKVEATVETFV